MYCASDGWMPGNVKKWKKRFDPCRTARATAFRFPTFLLCETIGAIRLTPIAPYGLRLTALFAESDTDWLFSTPCRHPIQISEWQHAHGKRTVVQANQLALSAQAVCQNAQTKFSEVGLAPFACQNMGGINNLKFPNFSGA